MAQENDPQHEGDMTDLSLTAIIQALDSGDPMPDADTDGLNDAFDPNATMNYQQAGVDYPEIPFADENNAGGFDVSVTPRASAQQGYSNNPASTGGIPSAREARPSARPSPVQRQTSSSSIERTAQSVTNTATRAARKPVDPDSFEDYSSNYRPINTQSSGYRIRGGGGFRFKTHSPVMYGIAVVFVVAALLIGGFAVSNIIEALSGSSSGAEFELTTTETREAIDARIPVLVDFIDTTLDDTVIVISEWGQYVYTNGRYSPDSPDPSAEGRELVSMPVEMSEEQMSGYYSGSYSAYSIQELTELFNGSYTLDMARGELGSWNKLKYVNFNATSIEDEMTHLASVQGLTGDTITISAQGVDSQGNKIVQGQKVISTEEGERILYFRIAACPFQEIYSAQTVSEQSVYITCTLATYDFYTGADEITEE